MRKFQIFSLTEIQINEENWLNRIGAFRLEVWEQETEVNHELFPEGKWIEPLDFTAIHWVALDEEGELAAAGRLTVHATLEDNPDGYLWIRAKRNFPTPVGHLCKLVVRRDCRGHGLGAKLNQVRLQAAQSLGAKGMIVTASEQNSRLLLKMGFVDTGIRETFPNRPQFEFKGLELIFGDKSIPDLQRKSDEEEF